MLSCKEVTAKADDFLDRRLSWRDRWRVRLHLLICHHCRRFVGQLRRTVETLQRMPPTAPDAETVEAQAERLHRALDGEGQ